MALIKQIYTDLPVREIRFNSCNSHLISVDLFDQCHQRSPLLILSSVFLFPFF